MATPDDPGSSASVRRAVLEGAIELVDVEFRYPQRGREGGRRVLAGVSLKIRPGERVGIIGPVGSGKSSIARLMLGLYQPDAGQVLIDGADIRQLHPDDLRASIGAVLQDVTLFSGSIRTNITLDAPAIDDAELIRASRLAGIDQHIGALENGYDLVLADRGEGLSGGQRQQIAIARALAGRPPILIMDEPTSAMDTATERALIQALAGEVAGRTLVLVTHRPDMLRLVDRVVVLADGKVALDGPRDAVLERMKAMRPPVPSGAAPPPGSPMRAAAIVPGGVTVPLRPAADGTPA
jgi:ATP-binding cassette subfamily C protein LapB